MLVSKSLVIGAAFLALAAASNGQSIGINFTGGGNASSPAISMLPTDSAGVVPQTNFNNVAGGSGTGLSLLNGSGIATPVTLTFTAGGTYSSIGGAAITP